MARICPAKLPGTAAGSGAVGMGGGVITQREELLRLFQENGNRLTLQQILESSLGYEWRARATELRREGYRIVLERGVRSQDNTYTLYYPEPSGQLRFA